MKSVYRLKKNFQYNYVYKHSKSVADKNFVLLFCKSNMAQTKVGFSVSKKFGHAVQRNRIRRQMKAVVGPMMPNVAKGYNVVLIPRRQGHAYTFEEVSTSTQKLFARAGLVK
ncbi:MAG: ribonuclease P protein component [Clostridia bacterium]|nr:ribonuclease P protein component [Clostridia bacterium]